MAIYIKGMEMPKKCYGCFEEYHPVNLLSGTCKLTGESTDGFAYKRREDCPLTEVSEPHGRLVDMDKALEVIALEYGYDGIEDDMEYKVPTVIERSNNEDKI